MLFRSPSSDFSSFYKDKKSLDGLNSWCKECTKVYHIEHGRKNINRRKETNRQWWVNNKKRVTKDKVIYNREWYAKNKERAKEQRKCKAGVENEKGREKYANDPLYHLRHRISSLIYQSLKAEYFTKNSKSAEYLCCSYEDFMKHLGPKPEGNIHLDHICPCAQAQNEEELIKLQHYSNFQWLPAEDNLKKYDSKTPDAEQKCIELLNREWIE